MRWLRAMLAKLRGGSDVDPRTLEAERAREEAARERDRVKEQWPRVREATRDLDRLGEAIHKVLREQR